MSEKKKISNKMLILIISIVLLSLVGLAGLTTTFLLNYNGQSPSKPLVLEDGENIYISTQPNDSYAGYRFKFSSSNGEIIIDSETNVISSDLIIEKGAQLGQNYRVSTCYLSEKEGNNSEYSDEITWLCSKYLSPVVATFDEETSFLQWNAVENADYYRVFCNGDGDYIETEGTSVDLSRVHGGQKVYTVLAYSNTRGFKTSNKANQLNVDLVHYLEGFQSIDFDENTNIVSASTREIYSNIYIYLDSNRFEVNMYSITDNQGVYTYSIDISAIFNGEKTIGILPVDQDEYNISNGQATQMTLSSAGEGDGE